MSNQVQSIAVPYENSLLVFYASLRTVRRGGKFEH